MIGKQPLQELQTLEFAPTASVFDNARVFQYFAVSK
jgi:hypothetical protein